MDRALPARLSRPRQRTEVIQAMEVGGRSRDGPPREVAARRALAVDRVGVGGDEIRGKIADACACAAVPAASTPLDRVFDGQVVRDDLSPACEAQGQVVAVGAEFELEVLIVPSEQEELDDLEVPEPIAASRRQQRGGIPVVGRLDLDLDRVAESELDAGVLVRVERPTVPAAANLEVEARHAYTPPTRVLSTRGRAPGRSDEADEADGSDESAVTGAQARDLDWLDGDDTQILPARVRAAFAELAGRVRLRTMSGGLLHQSFHVRAENVEYVLQHVSDVFAPEIHQNIQAVSRHLLARGLRAARLLPTKQGELSAPLGPLGRWRLMEHLGGASFEKLAGLAQARSAGELVGRFHAALLDFDEPLAPMGIPYRDTPRYLAGLRAALERHRGHRLYGAMAGCAARVFEAFEILGPPSAVRERVIHGDLKLSNFLFESVEGSGRDRALALVDFDTLMRGTLWMELGDAWRSWCNAAGEDSASPRFDLEVFAASCAGFAAGYAAALDRAELESLSTAPERITLELCARFVTDALEESYFGWDETRFPARGEHNAARAEGQWQLYEATRATRARRRELVGLLSR